MAEAAEEKIEKVIPFPSEYKPQQFTMTQEELYSMIENIVEKTAAPKKPVKKRRTDSLYLEDGRRKPAPADPIRSKEDFWQLVTYLGDNERSEFALRNRTLFILGCSVGLRCGDLLKLKTNDVYTIDGKVKEHLETIEQKTGKRNTCKIPKMAVKALDVYRKAYNFSIDNNTYLFQSKKGGRLQVRSVSNMLREAGENCGLQIKLSTHSMRKTYAMAALLSARGTIEEGATLELLQMKLNHSDQRTTMLYCKAGQDQMDEMSDRVSSWFDGE